MSSARPRRSALYMPAGNPRAIAKARELACDVVILDLEDSVAPDAKTAARDLAIAAITEGGFGRRERVVRVNGLDTPWGEADLAAVAASPFRPDAVLAPKVSSPADVEAYAAHLPAGVALWIMIETCASLFALDRLASAGGPLSTLVVGSNDLVKEMRCRVDADRRPLQAALSLTVAAGRAHGLSVLDGVWNDIADLEGLERQCRQGVEFGFDGKTLIHPDQIVVANRAFAPEPDEVAWARTIAAAFDSPENRGKGVLRVEGRMVERLHLDQALRLLEIAAALEEA
ncbi:CoA ester lyase [Phenylobacterium sp.]|uniref:HpcH/HpaI aldolase/citrate lyase family protein n=1 Tax=Phenylobacterium sp. TaxID=1871053 RepID=UPI0025FD7FA6|nr:CoA ester lyase [Phenylobacterium sp.]MCA6287403.1 CoA ester lyase [Phenylobacterium sp.]MCA6289884.1 CoA ester lyase [Phenylobacterium sp.]MCA6309587.1 CoA ester lyase [Phenylobacterium sp.]MCA6323012.1 CoA ester lyase [Phenylobacterium sp.]MCA6337564.1 CoA ester lyase [Phenylobacterium sp.]